MLNEHPPKGRKGSKARYCSARAGYRTRLSAFTGRLLLILLVIFMAACSGQRTIVTHSDPSVAEMRPIPTPTDFPIGSGQPAPLRDSMALIRANGTNKVAGAALVITSDGFLMTVEANLVKNTEIVLPDGQVATPIRIATDSTTGLTLLKVSASRLVPVRLGLEQLEPLDKVFAEGFDETTAGYGQVAGQIVETGPTPPSDNPAIISTNIDFAQGFSGGVLSDASGQLIGMITSGQGDSGRNVISAIPVRYVAYWITKWRTTGQEATSQSASWPSLSTVSNLTLRYPVGWSVADENRSGSSYFADITPNDPDVPAKLSVSIEKSDFQGNPIDFAHSQFDNKSSATIWGEVEYDQIKGVRILVNQEGARVDVVYLFARGRRIAVSLSAGYSITDTGAQEQRMTALFEAVLRSISFTAATPTD